MRVFLFSFLNLLFFINVWCQQQANEMVSERSAYIGIELQGYPTGLISTLKAEFVFNNANAITTRVGYNFLNHRDLGKHDTEKGGGLGFSVGYKRYFENEGLKGFYVGAKNDVWFNNVNWAEFENNDKKQTQFVAAKSKVVVLQPTIEAGYKLKFTQDKLAFIPSIAFGYEWNVKTTLVERNEFHTIPVPDPDSYNLDPATGQGIIVLLGFSFLYSIQ